MEVIVIGLVALVTAIISAVAGLGGGIILLAVIAQFRAPAVAIPIHGCIQLFSNGFRTFLLRDGVNWRAVAYGSVLLAPAALLGVQVATSMPEDATRIAMAIFMLIASWRPKWLGWDRPGRTERGLVPVGALSGFLSATVGASGPVVSPFYRAVTASHRAFVATAGCTQVLSHAAKIGGFVLDGFDLGDHLTVIGVAIAGVAVGTWIGTNLLERADERRLSQLFKLTLTVLAFRLLAVSIF
ncbi:MAG: sulfite exporter TauE/SafE family protein [Actinomycetota bacterium]